VKLREKPGPVFDPPPLRLRRWTWSGTAAQPAGEATGAQVYGSRPEWVAARRVWEAARGQSIAGWYADVSARARAERGFDGWAEMREFRPDPDQEDDPGAW
jgi:hypothetical protein